MIKLFTIICFFVLSSSIFASGVTDNGRGYKGLITDLEAQTDFFYTDNTDLGCGKHNSKIVFVSLYEESSDFFYVWDYKNDDRIRSVETIKDEKNIVKYVLTKTGKNRVSLLINHEINIPGKPASMKILKAEGKIRKIWLCPDSVSYVIWDNKKYNEVPLEYKKTFDGYRESILRR